MLDKVADKGDDHKNNKNKIKVRFKHQTMITHKTKASLFTERHLLLGQLHYTPMAALQPSSLNGCSQQIVFPPSLHKTHYSRYRL